MLAKLRDRYSTPGHRRIQTSFPIATINDDQKAFKKSVDQNIPGLVANHPAIFVLLESFQFYSSANNRWLPEFRILTNGDKHEKLSLISGLVGRGRMLEPYLGRPVYEIDAAGRTIEELMHGSCALIPRTEPDGYEFAAAWVRFEETGRSVDGFLRRALIGVRQILESLKPYISQSSGCT